MAVDERRRIALHGQVAAAWGQEAAETLFELLIPPGHDPATRQDVRAGVAELDQRLDGVDGRFDGIDRRLDGSDRRLHDIDERLDGIDQRLDGMDWRFAEVDHRFALLEEHLDARFASLRELVERRVADAVTTQTRTVVVSQVTTLVAIAGLAVGLG